MKRIYLSFLVLFSCLLTSQTIAQQGEDWALIMSTNTGFTDQIWRTRNYFPKEEIKEFWDKGYSITSISYGSEKWALVMSKGHGYGLQYWSTSADFPAQKIKDYWDKGYNITQVAYGDGQWVLIMTQNSGLGLQMWRTRNYFPEKEIEEAWASGYYITGLDYGNGLWALVMSKNSGYNDQIWRTRTYFPVKEIEEGWSSGYRITNLTYANGLWALVMSKGTGYSMQIWRTRNYFPQNEISEFWDKSYDITGIYHGNYNSTPNKVVTYKKAVVSWNIPYANNTKVNKGDYAIKACVQSETALSKVSLYLNGVLQNDSRGYDVVPDDGCDNTIERQIKLKEGNNELKLVVENKGGPTTAEIRNVFFEAPKVVNNNPVTPVINTNKEKRLALVIGNANYTQSPLKNPVNDARSIAQTLSELGFEVMKYENVNQAGMKKAIDDYGAKLKNYTVGLVFYAGHGVQVKGNNYLIPLGVSISSENDVEYECVNAGRILSKMETAGSNVNIIIMDACRDNPFERSWSRSTQGNGLASMDAPLGSIVCYSTSPGRTASDGTGNNGLYTEELLKHLKTPNISLEEVFKKVRVGVVQKSNKEQTPWETSSLTGNFYFLKQ